MVGRYREVVGDHIDSPYSILSDLVELEVFLDDASEAEPFDRFFDRVTVVAVAELGIGEEERDMLVVLFLNFHCEYIINLEKRPYMGTVPQCRFIDSMRLLDEAGNIMKHNFDMLRQTLLQGRQFCVGALLASQFLSQDARNGLHGTTAYLVCAQGPERDAEKAAIDRVEQGVSIDRRTCEVARSPPVPVQDAGRAGTVHEEQAVLRDRQTLADMGAGSAPGPRSASDIWRVERTPQSRTFYLHQCHDG